MNKLCLKIFFALAFALDCGGESPGRHGEIKFVIYFQEPITMSAIKILKFWSKRNVYACILKEKHAGIISVAQSHKTALILDVKAENKTFLSTARRLASTVLKGSEKIKGKLFKEEVAPMKKNLQGAFLRIARVTSRNCDNVTEETATVKTACFQQEIVTLMGLKLNFTPIFVDCSDKKYPFVLPNGSYSGVFNMLQHGSADASCASLVVSGSRLASFDFVWPTFILKTVMFVKRDDVDSSWKSYFKPLDESVWLLLFSWIFLSGSCCYVSGLVRDRKNVGLAESFLASFQAFCNQGLREVPECDSWKIICACTLFLSALIFPAYSGSVVSFLTVRSPRLPFGDLRQFFENGKYEILAKNGSFIAFYFKHEYLPLYQPNKSHLLADVFRLPRDDRGGLDEICVGKTSYVGLKEDVDNVRLRNCEIMEIPTPVAFQYQGLGLPKRSRHTRIFTVELSYIRSVGILHRMKTSLCGAFPVVKEKSSAKSLTLSETFSGFVLFVLGSAFSLFLLLCETIIKKKN